MKKFLTALLLFFVSTAIALGDGLKKIEILGGWERSDGSIVFGLKISVNEGWKTYWHTPGVMGLKPNGPGVCQYVFQPSLSEILSP